MGIFEIENLIRKSEVLKNIDLKWSFEINNQNNNN